MARVKSFFGSDLKTGGYVIGYVSLFANIINFILAIETILITFIEPSQEKKALFGNYINEISASSIAFTFVLFALVASLYGIIASLLLICGVCTANRKRVLWWLIFQPFVILSILAIGIYAIVVRANYEKAFFDCWYFESLFIISLLTALLFIAFHVYFFIVIIEFYLQLKAAEPAPVEDVEVTVVKEEELQLLESPKLENADETDKPEEKTAEEEKKEEEAATSKASKIRCPELPKCPSLKCPSWGNCVGPDNFE